jgi:mannose-6-phosphate isomerase-like protein (cupin superfamily)
LPKKSIDLYVTLIYPELMVNTRSGMKTEVRENMRGGKGNVEFVHLADCEKEKNIRMLAEVTLQPGCSVGYHKHENETEYFIIVSGTGTVNDDGVEKEVKAGDMTITGNGASHGVINTGNVPLVLHAVIVTY